MNVSLIFQTEDLGFDLICVVRSAAGISLMFDAICEIHVVRRLSCIKMDEWL